MILPEAQRSGCRPALDEGVACGSSIIVGEVSIGDCVAVAAGSLIANRPVSGDSIVAERIPDLVVKLRGGGVCSPNSSKP